MAKLSAYLYLLYNISIILIWPPNSPDFNPLDFYFWNAVVKRLKRNLIAKRSEFVEDTEKACTEISI